MKKKCSAAPITVVSLKCFLLNAVVASFCFSTVAAQIKISSGTGQAKDVIVSSGGVREGKLAGCVADVCSMDNVSSPRSTIVWIGLNVTSKTPPSPTDPARDEVRYHDGSVHPGRMSAINAFHVATDRGRHPRATVAWVYLLPKGRTSDTGPPSGTPSPTPTRSPTPTPNPAPGPTPATGAVPAGRRGGLWTGTVTRRQVVLIQNFGPIYHLTTIEGIRLREYVDSLRMPVPGGVRSIGTATYFVVEGGRINSQVRGRQGNGGIVCTTTGEGSTTLLPKSAGSHIYKKNSNVDTTPAVGWNIPSGPGVYVIALHPVPSTYSSTQTCVYPDKTMVDTTEHNFPMAGFGRIPLNNFADDYVDPEIRSLDGAGGRMIGSYTRTPPGIRVTVSWSICREGVTCAAPPAGDGAISLGSLFVLDGVEFLGDAKAKLEGVLTRMRAESGLMPEIRVILKSGDPLWVYALASAQIEVLKDWFSERGIDPSRLFWAWETGANDQVMVLF